MSDTLTSAIVNTDTPETVTDATETVTAPVDSITDNATAEAERQAEHEAAIEAARDTARTEALAEARTEHDATIEKLAEAEQKASRYETEVAALRIAFNMTSVSYEQGVPVELLQGETREEIEGYAAALKAWKADKPAPAERTRRPLRSGANIQDDMLNARQQAAQLVNQAF